MACRLLQFLALSVLGVVEAARHLKPSLEELLNLAIPLEEPIPESLPPGVDDLVDDNLEFDQDEDQENDREEDDREVEHLGETFQMLHTELFQVQVGAQVLSQSLDEQKTEVKMGLSEFASATGELTMSLSMKILANLNMCDEEKRDRVAAAASALSGAAAAVAGIVAPAAPDAEDLGALAQKAAVAVAILGKELGELAKLTAQTAAESPQVQNAVSGLQKRVEDLLAILAAKIPHNDAAEKVATHIAEIYRETVSLSKTLATTTNEIYHRESVQRALAGAHEIAGQLAAAAVKRWPEVKEKLQKLAHFGFEQFKPLAKNLLEAVNLCDETKRESVGAALQVIGSRMEQIAVAIGTHEPEVKQKIGEVAAILIDKLALLSTSILSVVRNAAEKKEVKALLTQLGNELAKVKKALAEKTTVLQPGLQGVVDNIKVLMMHLGKWSGHADLDESEVKAAMENCLLQDVKYHPANMAGQKRTEQETAEECRKHCEQTQGCAYFSYWKNKGCHLQDSSAKPRRALGVMAGPVKCE